MSWIDVLLDRIDWTPVDRSPQDGSLPHVTHEGILNIGPDVSLTVYQLSDGQRVIDQDDFERYLHSFEEDAMPGD